MAVWLALAYAFVWHIVFGYRDIYKYGFMFWAKNIIAGIWLRYLRGQTKRRLDLYDLDRLGDPEKLGVLVPKLEWELESPQPKESLTERADEIFFYGVNSKKQSLTVHFTRFANGMAEIWLNFRDIDGSQYFLPKTLQVDHSGNQKFSAAGIQITCVLPMRTWRITFNGLLKNKNTNRSHHIKFSFIVRCMSTVYDETYDISPIILSNSAALGTYQRLKKKVQEYSKGFDIYEQTEQFIGTCSIDGNEEREIYMWGLKMRTREVRPILEETKMEHYIGYLQDGTIYHAVSQETHGERLTHGYVMESNSFLYPLDKCAISYFKAISDIGESVHLMCRRGTKEYHIKIRHERESSEINEQNVSIRVFRHSEVILDKDIGYGISLIMQRREQPEEGLKKIVFPPGKSKQSTDLVLPLENAEVSDVSGGKGSSLAVLTRISQSLGSFQVPKGICVTVNAYKLFREENTFDKDIDNLHKSFSQKKEDKVQVSSQLMDIISNGYLPASLRDDITAELTKVFGSEFEHLDFAVRSSAVGEDSEELSAAGQMETFLHVRGINEILNHVLKCWASQFSHIALEYKWQHGQILDSPMAVVIQEMVSSEIAGVLFTCNPVTGNPTEFLITSNYGLGESVVSSAAEPDTLTLECIDDNIKLKEVNLGSKKIKTVASGSGGVENEETDKELASKCSLSEKLAVSLGSVALEIMEYYSLPLDIEWACIEERIYLLQARPITTIHKESDFEIAHECDEAMRSEDEFYTSANVAEVLPGALSHLGYDYFMSNFKIMFGLKEAKKILSLNRPPLYYFNYGGLGICQHSLMSLTDGMLQFSEEENLMTKGLLLSMLARTFDTTEIAKKAIKRHGQLSGSKKLGQFISSISALRKTGRVVENCQKIVENLSIPLDDSQSSLEMFEVVKKHWILEKAPYYALLNASISSSTYNILVLLILGSVEGDFTPTVFADFSKLLSNCKDIESADVPNRLQDLGRILRKSKPEFSKLKTQEALSWLQTTEEEAGDKYRDFIKRHGHRCIKEFDIAAETWELNPEALVKTLQSISSRHVPEKESVDITIDDIETPLNFWRRRLLQFLLPRVKQAVGWRERAKALLVKKQNYMRLACRKLGKKMVEEGRIPDTKLIFFLKFDELQRLLTTRSPALVNKAVRRMKLQPELNKLTYPDIIRGLPKPINQQSEIRIEGQFVLKGTPVSQGKVKGIARVVYTLEEADTIQPGEILITNATDIGWTPYFPILGGIVTQVGGLLSHGAVVAREYGLPCVIGIPNATAALKSGDAVFIDSSQGTVTRLEEGRSEES